MRQVIDAPCLNKMDKIWQNQWCIRIYLTRSNTQKKRPKSKIWKEWHVLTIRKIEVAARAAGMATEVILSIGPLRYVCLWMLWKYFCFSKSFSLGLKGASNILHQWVKRKEKEKTCFQRLNIKLLPSNVHSWFWAFLILCGLLLCVDLQIYSFIRFWTEWATDCQCSLMFYLFTICEM